MNTQPRHPKCRALPVELHPDIQFLPLYHGGRENQRFFCLWSFLWSKPLLCRFQQPEENPLSPVLQGFAAFRLAPSWIRPRHSQTTRSTICATPGYSISAMIPQQRGKSWFSLHAVKSHETIRIIPCYPTMPQLKKQQEAGRKSARLPHF